MKPETIINLILSISSFVLAATSVVTVVITLLQNRKMTEASTRPYLGIYTVSSNIGKNRIYIILKNFGQSSAIIKELSTDIDLTEISKMPGTYIPFSGLLGSTIMPGQSFRTIIDYKNIVNKTEIIKFTLKYSGPIKEYSETLSLKLTSNSGNLTEHSCTPGKELSEISETLQEMHLKSL